MYVFYLLHKTIRMSDSASNCLSSSSMSTMDGEKLVKPKQQLHTLLQQAGADKEIFTMKEVMFYLGQYIMEKELYDKKQQHIVHCSNDLLGDVLGVHSFSVKEPRVLYAMISKNLTAVKNTDNSKPLINAHQNEKDKGQETEAEQGASMPNIDTPTELCNAAASGWRRRRSSESALWRRGLPSKYTSVNDEQCEPHRKRHKSDSISLTFDDSLSWCVIGGLKREHVSSISSSDSHLEPDGENASGSEDSDETWFSQDSNSDNFSVEFEVESIYSDTYSQDEEDQDLTDADDEVYEVTIYEAEDDDSFDEDTEISEADYWKCSECEEVNPPLPRHCHRCWSLRKDWFPDDSKSCSIEPVLDKPCTEEGIDVPDGKRSKHDPPIDSKGEKYKNASPEESGATSCDSQEILGSQPSTSANSTLNSQEVVPELEREASLESCLPPSCLDPCVICQSRPKNGCIVHGRTGHLMSCYTCAKKLKKRNKLCPVCRQPIQMVVLTYFS
ncbi:E3 ubiquitin-protein ligase Mdm2 isoform X3 [Polypterus senegalus]|uniref:E3 ubiquitin-protein ligase Mdm2 isoform X3 n=1 Tax=Polypterus senegalus TaxID=55291 RepID=UPI001966134A|nr:E3 ubiquitin-protein ligase Mdm2 isoform X3 [Polypterus senegalus]